MRLRHVEREMLKLGLDDVAFAKKKVGKKGIGSDRISEKLFVGLFSSECVQVW